MPVATGIVGAKRFAIFIDVGYPEYFGVRIVIGLGTHIDLWRAESPGEDDEGRGREIDLVPHDDDRALGNRALDLAENCVWDIAAEIDVADGSANRSVFKCQC